MAQERESKQMAEFFKFNKIGQSVVGWIETFGQGGQYGTKYALFEPVLIRERESAPLRRFGSVAIGLSADLLSKFNLNRDAQHYFGLKYIDDQPSGKGSPKKVFRVMQLQESEYMKLQEQADMEFQGVPYKAPEDTGDVAEAFDDDLGF